LRSVGGEFHEIRIKKMAFEMAAGGISANSILAGETGQKVEEKRQKIHFPAFW
jgi:hypothetical protein